MNTFNLKSTAKALDTFVTSERDARKAMDAYAVKLGKEFNRCEVTEKKGAAFVAAREQFIDAYGRRNGKLGLIKEARKLGGKASKEAVNALGAASKMWGKVSSAAIEGTTVEAQQHRNKKPVTAQGAKDSPKGGANGAQTSAPDTPSEGTGNPSHLSVVTGIGEEASAMLARLASGDTVTPRQLEAAFKSILTKAEIVTGKQIG